MKCRSPRPVMRFRFFGIGVKRRPPFANFAKGRLPRMPVLITSRYYLKVVTSKIIHGEGTKRDPPARLTTAIPIFHDRSSRSSNTGCFCGHNSYWEAANGEK